MSNFVRVSLLAMAVALSYARTVPKIQYDDAKAYVTLPVNLSVNVDTFLQMGEHVVAALADKSPVNIILKGYVISSSNMREVMRVQYILQRLERRMHAAMPNASFAIAAVEKVSEHQLLPAWRMSTANTVPSAYIAIIIQPIIN